MDADEYANRIEERYEEARRSIIETTHIGDEYGTRPMIDREDQKSWSSTRLLCPSAI